MNANSARLFSHLVTFDTIDRDELNRALVSWDHRMGPLNRPRYGFFGGDYGLRYNDELVAVVATERMIAEQTCDLTRDQAFELARVCAIRPDLCRAIVRLWREFVFPAMCDEQRGRVWAISYQDAVQHNGNLYRHDGWVRLGETRSGTDRRGREGARNGRVKVVWGWTADAGRMAAARAIDQQRQAQKTKKPIAISRKAA